MDRTFFSSYVFTCIECIFCLLIHINKYRANEIEKIEIVVRQLFVIQLFVGWDTYITYMYVFWDMALFFLKPHFFTKLCRITHTDFDTVFLH